MKLRSKYLLDAARAFDRAPVEVALAVVSAVLISYCIHTETNIDESVRFLIAAVLVALLAWRSTLLYGLGAIALKQRWVATLVGGAVGATYLLLVPTIDLAAEGWRAFLLLTATLLYVFAAPGWVPRNNANASLRLRRINGRVVLRIIGGYLYGLALFAGLALAVVAIDKLFELKLKEEVYAHLYTWIMVVLVPWVIVGGIDDYVKPIEDQSDVARVVHRMSSFLVPPLIVLYFVILYTYALRIAVTHELPQNLVSPMVIAAGLLVALGLILFDPAPEAVGGQRLLRYASPLVLPLVPLGLWGLVARIDQYGWTEFRLLRIVVLVLLLVLALLATLQIIRRQHFTLRVIPLAFSFVLALCAIGPWGVLPIAKHDQQNRLVAALHQAGVDINKPPLDTTRRELPGALFDRISGGAMYLRSHFGKAAVAAVLPVFVRADSNAVDVAAYYHLMPKLSNQLPRMLYGQLPSGVAVPVGDGNTVYRVALPTLNKDTVLAPRVTRDTLRVVIGPDTMQIDLRAIITALRPRVRSEHGMPPVALTGLKVTDTHGRQRGYLTVLEISVDQTKGGHLVQRLDGLLTVR